MNEYDSFRTFMGKNNRTKDSDLLVQAIALLSTCEEFIHETPEEIYNTVVDHTRVVNGELRG